MTNAHADNIGFFALDSSSVDQTKPPFSLDPIGRFNRTGWRRGLAGGHQEFCRLSGA
jgi:hypothetical protein